MNPRVSRSSALASKATGFPIAKIAAKLADRLHARRDPQRHHQGNPGLLRAHAGLRRGQGAAVRLREVPRRRPHADHDDEVRRRGDVVGPQLHRGARQGDAVAGDQAHRILDGSGHRSHRRRAAGAAADADRRPALRHRTGAAAGRLGRAGGRGLRGRPVVRRADRRTGDAARRGQRAPRARRRPAAALQAQRAVGPPDRRAAAGIGRRGRRAVAAAAARHPSGLQDRRHLRRGVRGQDAVPLQQLRTRPRGRDRGGAADREAQGADPRLGAEPDRPGHRVRLQLRARRNDVVRRPVSRP